MCASVDDILPGRAGVLSPVGLRGVCPVLRLFNFLSVTWHLLNRAINMNPLA